MNWDALSAIAGAVGALGVIVTLLYLALQVRHATRVAKADFFFRSIEGWIDFNLRVADNEELSELLWKTLESPGELSRTEELRSRHLLSGIFRIGERLYYARRDDLITEQIFSSHLGLLVRLSRMPGGLRWLEDWGSGLDPEFRAVLERSE